jgi:WD40 repeat protein
MPVSSLKTFRLFVSSTFADLGAERDALQYRVFPRLRDFCEQHGARFSPVDLRWGVSTDAGQDRRTMSICVEEIHRCQQTTPRPNFIILLGARYGWRPLPAEIAVEDLERLRSTAPLQRGLPLFERLYPTIDLNAVPPVYCLRPRTGDVDGVWNEMEREVLATLANAAMELDWPFTKRVIFGGSATEQEISCGLFSDTVLPAAGEHVHAFLSNPGDDPRPAGAADSSGDGLDDDAQRLHALKERLRATLGANVHEYDINANEAAARLDRLCEDVYAALAHTMEQEAERFTRLDPLDREIDAHDAFALERNKIFDVRERRESASESMPGTVVSCAFTNDGRRVVACSTKEIRVWDFDAGRLEARVAWKADEAFIGCAAMPGTDQLIAGLESGRFVLWDIATEQPIAELPGHRGLIMFSLSRDGRLLAATSEQGVVWIWDVQERPELMTLHGHRERVVACNFSPDGTHLVTGSWDATVRSWDLASPGKAIVLAGHTDQLQDCCFTPDGARVLSAAVDGSVRLWDARSGTALRELLWAVDSASLCAFGADGRSAVAASCRHGIKVWNGDTGEPMRLLSGHQEAVRACTFLPDGRLLSASADGTLRVWAIERDEAASIAGTHHGPVGACAISPDGAWIASAGQDRCVRLWDPRTGASLATLEGHDDWVRRVLIVANGSRIVSCSLDNTARVWNSATRQVVHVLRGHRAALSAVAASADGSQLLTGDESGTLYVWDLATGNRRLMLSGHRGAITACAFPGTIVSASRDGTLRLWDAASGDTIAELTGHTGPVLACAVSTDLRHVVSASEDRFVKVWDLADGQQRAEYWVGAAALSVSWHPTRQRIAVGDAMGTLHLLELEGATADANA